uniref:Uncharacterized protein n=1 Tax=Leptosiphonia brodiei TaxID=2608611 RepID=A0A1Z1MAY0_9FLOR|nr:hypothetical protein [Leptosiphonia brodiei]ARW62981.1 hypothetical protein [Leptosiphonia brodiei]
MFPHIDLFNIYFDSFLDLTSIASPKYRNIFAVSEIFNFLFIISVLNI